MYAPGVPQDRLVRKETALGFIRELPVNEQFIGVSQIAPMQEVASDDVIFEYLTGALTDGLAPARAEDAEAELAQKDEFIGGYGRASIIDWATKDHYSASDVSKYTEALYLAGIAGQNVTVNFPLTLNAITDGFAEKVARNTASRRRRLDNRLEWLVMQSVENSVIAYNDGKIKFSVDWQRPGGQTNAAPANGLWTVGNAATSDPVRDFLAVKQFMYDTYGIVNLKAVTSTRVANSVWNSAKFAAALLVNFPQGQAAADPTYVIPGWGPEMALKLLTQASGVPIQVYDGIYRTRALGSTTTVNNRFTSDNKIFFLPSDADVAAIDDAIGFAKTLTSGHPEGNWQSGFYEWEQETKDPWGRDNGTGIKAFPVFPHLDMTYTMTVL